MTRDGSDTDTTREAVSGLDSVLRAACEAIRDAVVITSAVRDPEGALVDEAIVFTNPAWRALVLGDPAAPDPVGERLIDVFPEYLGHSDIHRRVISDGVPIRYEGPLPGAPDGTWFDTEHVRLGDGMMAISRDVSVEHEARLRLHASDMATRAATEADQRFATAMEHAPIGMAMVAPDGRFLEVNVALCRMLDRSADALRTMSWQAVTHPDDLAPSQALAREALSGVRAAYRQRTRYLRPDGVVVWVELSVAPIRDADGSVRTFVSQFVDVTEEVRANLIVQDSEERYRTLVDELESIVFTRDYVTGDVFCSARVETILGHPPETMVQRGVWRSMVVEEDRARAIAAWDSDPPGDQEVLEYRMQRADGTVVLVEERRRIVRDTTGRVVREYGVISDVTARRRMEETLARTDRLEAVGRVAAAAARDFGTIVTAIQFYQGNLVESTPEDDPRAEDIKGIGDTVELGVQLTRQLLAFGRERAVEEAAPLDIAWLLADLEPILRGVAGTAGLEIRLLGNGLARISRGALEQAILNLVINSRDAMEAGGSIAIYLGREEVPADSGLGIPPGVYLALTVADTGPGMPDSVRERAMEPFFTTKERGTGTGLAQVYAAMRAVWGTVRIDSRAGEGTRVVLLMPDHTATDLDPLEGDAGIIA